MTDTAKTLQHNADVPRQNTGRDQLAAARDARWAAREDREARWAAQNAAHTRKEAEMWKAINDLKEQVRSLTTTVDYLQRKAYPPRKGRWSQKPCNGWNKDQEEPQQVTTAEEPEAECW